MGDIQYCWYSWKILRNLPLRSDGVINTERNYFAFLIVHFSFASVIFFSTLFHYFAPVGSLMHEKRFIYKCVTFFVNEKQRE